MINRPKIALSVSFDEKRQLSVNEDYLNAIYFSGGLGVVVPYTTDGTRLKEYAEYFDGFLFCGGGDISPTYYNQSLNISEKNICSCRDRFEKELFDVIYPSGKSILGICRGEQIINVFLGGDLLQHIENHMQNEGREVREQKLRVVGDSFLEKIAGEKEMFTNSFHHQAVNRLGRGLVADAYSADGYIEAFHSAEHKFCLGVQWHPEAYYKQSHTASAIFDSFIKSCIK